jgi:hypothetical protein
MPAEALLDPLALVDEQRHEAPLKGAWQQVVQRERRLQQ